MGCSLLLKIYFEEVFLEMNCKYPSMQSYIFATVIQKINDKLWLHSQFTTSGEEKNTDLALGELLI